MYTAFSLKFAAFDAHAAAAAAAAAVRTSAAAAKGVLAHSSLPTIVTHALLHQCIGRLACLTAQPAESLPYLKTLFPAPTDPDRQYVSPTPRSCASREAKCCICASVGAEYMAEAVAVVVQLHPCLNVAAQ